MLAQLNQYTEYIQLAAYGIAAVAVLGLTVWAALWVWRRVFGQLKGTRAKAQEIVAKAEKQSEVSESLKRLRAVMDQLERADSAEAGILITDASMLASTLLKAAQQLAKQAVEYRERLEVISEAQNAIAERDHPRLAYCAGSMASWDDHLGRSLTDQILWRSEQYLSSVTTMLGVTRGDIEQWSRQFDEFSGSLITQLAIEKTRIEKLAAARDFVPVAKDLIALQQRLVTAENKLRIDQPSIRHALTLEAGPAARLLR